MLLLPNQLCHILLVHMATEESSVICSSVVLFGLYCNRPGLLETQSLGINESVPSSGCHSSFENNANYKCIGLPICVY